MAYPRAFVNTGDMTVETPDSANGVTEFGWGDLSVARNCAILGTTPSTSISAGALVVAGGAAVGQHLRVARDTFLTGTLTVDGESFLNKTTVDTSRGKTTVRGPSAFDVSVGDFCSLISTRGNVHIASNLSDIIVQAGGGISLTSGTSGMTARCSGGGLFVSADTRSFIEVDDDLLVSMRKQGGALAIESSGDVSVRTLSSSGNILIGNTAGSSSGVFVQAGKAGLHMTTHGTAGTSVSTGSAGFGVTTNTGGPVQLAAFGAPSHFINYTLANAQHLRLSVRGNTASNVIIDCDAPTPDAIRIENTSPQGGTLVSTGSGGLAVLNTNGGATSIHAGSGGFSVDTQTTGSITMTATGAGTLYANNTTADSQDLVVAVRGNTDSSVRIESSGTSSIDAVNIAATHGGVLVSAAAQVSVQAATQVLLGTDKPNVPVVIGNAASLTTVQGDALVVGNLTVSGTSTTVNVQNISLEDNIVLLNSGPTGTADGGIAVKRFQTPANDGIGGDVVSGAPDESGQAGGSNTFETVQLGLAASAVNDAYAGCWIKLTGGTGEGQVRRIKSYDGATRIATIFNSADHASFPQTPREGMDWVTVPDTTTTYGIHSAGYMVSYWDEQDGAWSFVSTSLNPALLLSGNSAFRQYIDVRVNALQAQHVNTSFLNGLKADIRTSVVLNDFDSNGVQITDVPQKSGVYIVMVRPATKSERPYAIFMMGRVDNAAYYGNIVRLISVRGTDTRSSQLDMFWNADEYPSLQYRPHPNEGSSQTEFVVKITCV